MHFKAVTETIQKKAQRARNLKKKPLKYSTTLCGTVSSSCLWVIGFPEKKEKKSKKCSQSPAIPSHWRNLENFRERLLVTMTHVTPGPDLCSEG